MVNDHWFRSLLVSTNITSSKDDDNSFTDRLNGWWQIARHHGYSEIIAAGIAVTGAAIIYTVYQSRFRRYNTVNGIPTRLLKGRGRIIGVCTTVNDGDTFRFYHTTFGPLTRIPRTRKGE
jgi:hypothetical protein